MSKKVAWLHTHLSKWMGGTRFIYEVSRRLNEKCDVELIVETISPALREKFENEEIDVTRVSSFSTYSMKYWLLFPFCLRKSLGKIREKVMKDRFDVLISSFFPMNWMATQLNMKSIYICFEPYPWFHDSLVINNFPFLERNALKFLKILYSDYDIRATQSADEILVLSRFIEEQIKQIYGRSALVCREGVDIGFFKRRVCPEVFDKYHGYKVILHVASLNTFARTDLVIKALPTIASKIPDVKLLIIRKLDNVKARKSLENLAECLGVSGRIEFLPFLDEELLPCYYSLANVLVQPTQNLSASLSIKEAMACETPVIGCLGDGTEEDIGEEGSGFLVPPSNVDQLALRTVQILENPSLARKMGKRGRERIGRLFTWDKVADVVWKAVNGDVKRCTNGDDL